MTKVHPVFLLRASVLIVVLLGSSDVTAQVCNLKVEARWVRFKLLPKRAVAVTEVQALEWLKEEPFDLRIALPDE